MGALSVGTRTKNPVTNHVVERLSLAAVLEK